MSNQNERVVALIDMDCFYCQVEVRLNPVHAGKPLAVVQYNQWKGGGTIAVNYEAREKGVKRGMRGEEAKQKCPDIVLVSVNSVRGKADLSKYRDAGKEVIDVFKDFCDCVERASIDEAYLDLTQIVNERSNKLMESRTLIKSEDLKSTFVVGFCPDDSNDEDARTRGLKEFLEDQRYNSTTVRLAVAAALVEEMRAAVLNRTGFHCSAGISHNKILAKLVCGIHKPRRQTVLPPSCLEQLFSALPVRKVRNLGGKFGSEVVEQLGCQTMGDLAKFSEKELQQRFDEKTGSWLYEIARGIDHEPVTPRLIPKSIGCSKNFPGRTALSTKEAVEHWMKELCTEVAERLAQDLQENKRRARLLTVTVSVDGTSTSRSGPLPNYDCSRITAEALSLISRTNQASASSPAWTPAIKMIAVSTGKFTDDESSRSSVMQNFFKQIPKKDSESSKIDGTETGSKHDISASVNSENQSKLDASFSTSSLNDSTQSNASKRLKKEKGSLESFFAKSQSLKPTIKSDSVLGMNSREETSLDQSNDQTSKICVNGKPTENSFFLNYLSKLKTEPMKPNAKVDSSSVKASDNNRLQNSESPSVVSSSKELDDAIIQVKEMFPNPLEVEDCVLSLLPSSMQETFYIWRARFRREHPFLSPEKTAQSDSRKNVTAKPNFVIASPKKPTENGKSLKPDRVFAKPKGSINTFFQNNRQDTPKKTEDPSSEGKPGCSYVVNRQDTPKKTDDPSSEAKPGCSYVVSEDSNSSDVFNVINEDSCEEMERCSICSRLISLRDFPEHADYHAALSLDEKLNKNDVQVKPPVQSGATPVSVQSSVEQGTLSTLVRKRGRPPKNDLSKIQRDKKLKSISAFFSVKESAVTQSVGKRA